MGLTQALHEIKSHEFAARLNVVSGTRSFFAAANKEPAVMSLCEDMSKSGEAREEVLGHIHDLSQLAVDRRYENPNDAALAILLWLTRFTAPDYSQIAADLVDQAPQCWYAKKLARRILLPPPVASGNSPVSASLDLGRPECMSSVDVSIMMNLAANLKGLRYYTGAWPSSGDSSTLTIPVSGS